MFKYKHKHICSSAIDEVRRRMTKTLTIRDEVYRKLVSAKENDESFSELFERLLQRQSPAEILRSLRGKIELSKAKKCELLSDLEKRREERRI